MKNHSLNHVFRLVWNEITGTWVAVAEHTAGRGKRSRRALALLAAVLLGGATAAQAQLAEGALPTGGRIAAGQASLTTSGKQLTVNQGTQRLVINWNSFDIGSGAGVQFVQPGRDSIALNRVAGGNPSMLLGNLSANGQVWLLNPGGVVFGSTAQVDVGGLVASSLALSDDDFLAGRHRFSGGTGGGAVVNQGRISADGGYVALLGPQVRNSGTIATRGGSTLLAAGDSLRLDLGDDGLLGVTVDRAVIDALAENSGHIQADGGLVVLSARGANKALDSVVNNTGVIEARSLVERAGRILLDGDAAEGGTHVSGTLDVSSALGSGGAITVTGRDIVLDGGATLDASGALGGGRILVGGGFQGQDPSVAHARTATVAADVALRADARDAGNGGQIVVWSDETTRFAGSLSARGGAASGDGGQLEVSGRQTLLYSGRADARASRGRTGDLLLDPTSIVVMGGGSGSGAIDGSTVYEKDLEAQNANVLLQATNSIAFQDLNLNGGDGTITLGNNISFRAEVGSASNNNLSFANAANTIEVFGTGSIYLQAGGTGTGSISNAPNLIAHGAGSNPGSLPTHSVTTVGSGTPGAGSITLFGADGVTVGGSLQTNGGYVRVWADSDNASGGGFTISAPVTTNGGNFHVSAGTGAVVLNSNMTLGTGRILFKADGSYTTGTKTLGGLLQASGAVNVDTPFVMNAGAGIYTDGVITFSNTVDLNTGSGALTLRAQAIDFTSATLNNLSTASLILQPYDPSTSMVLGDANGFASAATLAKLPGIKNLTIGRSDGTGTTSVASDFSFAANTMMEIINGTIDISQGTLNNTAGSITLTGDNINIARQVTANGGAGAVTIRQMTAANAITLGSGLSSAAVGQINAATLVIGRADGGNLSFDSDIATNASSVHLLSGGTVTGVAGGVSAANLAITAGGGATISDSTFDFSTLALAVGGPTSITRSGSVTLGSVAGLSGLSVNSGSNTSVTLQADSIGATGPLALNNTTSTVTLRAGTVNLAGITTASGLGNASLVLQPLAAGDDIVVGGAGGFASAASLAKLGGARNVTVGRDDGTGALTVAGNVSLAAGGTLRLVNGSVDLDAGSVTNTTGALTLDARTGNLTLDRNASAATTLTLAATAGQSIGGSGAVAASGLRIDAAGADVSLTAAGNDVATLAADAASLTYRQTNGLTIGTVGATQGITATGAVNVRTTGAGADLTLASGITSGGAGDAIVLGAGRNFLNNAGSLALFAPNGRWLVYSGSPLLDTRGGLVPDFKQYDAAYGATPLGLGNGFLYRIAPTITVGLTGTVTKTYDGNDTATLAAGNFTSSGAIDGDSVSFTPGSATYADKNAATGKTVTATGLALSGASNGGTVVYGYTLASTTASAAIGSIDKATLTLGAATVADKVYDGMLGATVTGVALGGVIGSDAVGATASGQFADQNAGVGKAVAVSGVTLTGADAGNYQLATTTTSSQADITPATLTLTGAVVADKVYDTTRAATVTGTTTSGRLGSDDVSVTGSGLFADKNVGNGKGVSLASLTLAGADAQNYVLDVQGVNASASITPATLQLGAIAVQDKVYDRGTGAMVGSIGLNGVLGGDSVGATGSAQFADKNVGVGKAVSVTGIALGGADAGNYQLLTSSGSSTASITPAALNVGAITVAGKVYDGTTAAQVANIALGGVIGGDSVTAGAQGSFADKNVGVGKAVSVTGIALGGADAGNYQLLTSSGSSTASITPAVLTAGTVAVADKLFDGTTGANVGAVQLVGVVSGDVVAGQAEGRFADPHIGSNKPVAVSGIVLVGADAGNYVLASTETGGQASILPGSGAKTTTVASDVLAPLTSPQVGSNGTAGGGAGSDIGANGGVGDLGGSTPPLVAAAGSAGAASGGAPVGSAGAEAGRVATSTPIELPQTVLTGNGHVSVSLGEGASAGPSGAAGGAGSAQADRAGAVLPVYSAQAGSITRTEGHYLVTESEGSLSLLADAAADQRAPALAQAVQRSAQATLPITPELGVTMRVDLLADGTLLVIAPSQAASLSPETLAAYGLLLARQSFAVAFDSVPAVVLMTEEGRDRQM